MSQPAYRLFNVELKRREQLSPALTRFVFGGPEVAEMKTLAADQRIKIFFPDASGQPPSLPGGSEWYQAYRSVEPARRPPMLPTPSVRCAPSRKRSTWSSSSTAKTARPRPGRPTRGSATACNWPRPTGNTAMTPAATNGNRRLASAISC